MTSDLRQLGGWIYENDWPPVPCPACLIGQTTLGETKPTQTADSARHQNHPDWESEWIFGFFSGVMRCGRPSCEEPLVITGAYRVGEAPPKNEWRGGQYGDYYRLRYAIPALPILAFPAGTPQIIRDSVTEASRVLWTDPASAANRLRVAVEQLLTDADVRRFSIVKHKRHRLTTQQRILEFKKRDLKVGDTLEAVKWIGNQGSPPEGSLSPADVLATTLHGG